MSTGVSVSIFQIEAWFFDNENTPMDFSYADVGRQLPSLSALCGTFVLSCMAYMFIAYGMPFDWLVPQNDALATGMHPCMYVRMCASLCESTSTSKTKLKFSLINLNLKLNLNLYPIPPFNQMHLSFLTRQVCLRRKGTSTKTLVISKRMFFLMIMMTTKLTLMPMRACPRWKPYRWVAHNHVLIA